MSANATIAIVGGGFCGTLAAIRLLRDSLQGAVSLPSPARVILIDPDAAGRGFAYRAGPDHWRLNTPADRMSAFAEQPLDFFEWARQRDASVDAGDFLPRSWYGDYLAARLARALWQRAPGVSFEHVRARVVDLSVVGDRSQLTLDNGERLTADRVLLALGNSAAACPLPSLSASEHYIADPLRTSWLDKLSAEPRVLVIGTGLTMIDVALSLSAERPRAQILALSRHGLLPRAHDVLRARVMAPFPAETALGCGPLHAQLRVLRRFTESWVRTGGNWPAVIQRVRQAMPTVWRNMPAADRQRFARHVRAWWEVHRHRAPPASTNRIEALLHAKQLQVRAGRLLTCNEQARGLEFVWRPRGSTQTVTGAAEIVVNATGPELNPSRSSCPLVRSLLAQGLARSDRLGLGWDTAEDGRLLDFEGNASRVLFYAGPLLRARVWEATAVPELREYVDRTVEALTSSLAQDFGARRPSRYAACSVKRNVAP